jgi:hypothetical protein
MRRVLPAVSAMAAVSIMTAVLAAAAGSESAHSPLVGQWQRLTRCSELVADLKLAGLGATVAQAWVGQTSANGESSFKPGSPKPTRDRPCRGAIARVHSHFFTVSGDFGSLDWYGDQVDDGSYTITGRTTVTFGGVSFHYTIKNGDTLALRPLLTPAMIRKANTHPAAFTPAFWAVTVAYQGHTWKRVPCSRCR